ncbi:MAG: ribulose-5-phosphate 4-epimerase/fuculose-1-phosphate aldolase [Hyphomicrobiaceae bacterium]|jgi:ribulose-5-phosphate 4-epimerase/fuculose-1-phosphate aldolase
MSTASSSNTNTDTANIRDLVSPEEWQTRVDLAAAYRLVAHYGWDDMIFTHISARVPGPDHHFLINPYGLLFEEITASSLIKVDLDGNAVMDSPYKTNPAGFTIHSAIHAAREDAKCVLHLHTLDGTAVSAMAEGLMPLNQTACLVRESVAYHDWEGVALDHDERPRLVADLGDKDTMILRNHGTMSVGETIAAAFIKIYYLERACSMQVRSVSGNRELHFPAADVVQKTGELGSQGLAVVADYLAWPALVRMLDRQGADYAL